MKLYNLSLKLYLYMPSLDSYYTRLIAYGFVVCFSLLTSNVQASANALLSYYEDIEEDLDENSYDIPIYLESNGEDNSMLGDVYAIIQHPFATVRDALTTPGNWCEIVPLHLNIKACTYQQLDQHCRLTFYTGRKFYEDPREVYRLDYTYKTTSQQADYFKITLGAEEGPLDTRDYQIIVEAIPLNGSSTFIHFSYSYDYGIWSNIAMTGYFATLGRNKVGFTVLHEDGKGNPVYIDGIRGVIERNAIRYFFAIQTFMDASSLKNVDAFETRISNWFDMTEKYHHQLYEMDKKDYLNYKRMERKDQLALQNDITTNFATDKANNCINTTNPH